MQIDSAAQTFEQQKLIRHENLLWLVIAQGFVIAPLLWQLPPWLGLVWLCSMVWRWRIFKAKAAFPNLWVKMLLGIGCLVGLTASYQGQFSVEPMVGFLVCAFTLKLLELRTRKDGLLLLFIGFIAVATQFLFATTPLAAIYAMGTCVMLITAWQTIYLMRPRSVRFKLTSGFWLLVHALPLMVVMFVVMPRLGPLWRVPIPEASGKTGFSDSVAPGDLGNLVKSSGTAFRVTFTGRQVPRYNDLYWRGIALERFDGRRWHREMSGYQAPLGIFEASDETSNDQMIDYEVMLEPHQYPWLFALAEPVRAHADKTRLNLTADGFIVAREPVFARLQYEASSIKSSRLTVRPLQTAERERLLALPKGLNPKSTALAHQWQAEGLTQAEIVGQALALYNQSFTYTLQPPLLGQHSIDDFLFRTQRGFCEHFASSFVVLMRAAGVPSRVVVGYQGGRFNRVENYWLIDQSDAHAWAEVWEDDIGWRRIDPTAAVAPERVEQGISGALDINERALVGEGSFEAPEWLQAMRDRLDAAGYVWHRWVLNYDSAKQNALLSRLFGGLDAWRTGLGLTVVLIALLGLYMFFLTRTPRARSSLSKALIKLERQLALRGFQRDIHESPHAYFRRIAAAHPAWQKDCLQLAILCEQAHYNDELSASADLESHAAKFSRAIKSK